MSPVVTLPAQGGRPIDRARGESSHVGRLRRQVGVCLNRMGDDGSLVIGARIASDGGAWWLAAEAFKGHWLERLVVEICLGGL